MCYELKPNNGRKSFYGKAVVNEYNGKKVLTSYTTEVAMIDNSGSFRRLWSGYSATTMNHINAFRSMNGLPAIGKKEWNSLETYNYNPLVDMVIEYNRKYSA